MRECFDNICRLCGRIGAAGIGGRNPHSKDKYRGLILRAVQIDVSKDSPSCHPPFICHNCFTKIQRWWKDAKRKKKSICNIEVVQFTAEHSCSVCSLTTDILSSMRNSVKEQANKHELLTWGTKDQLRVMRFNQNGQQELVLLLERDMSWKMLVCEFDISLSSNSVFSDVPSVLGIVDVSKVFGILSSLYVCNGNSDFGDVVVSREGPRGQIPVSITGSDVYQSHPFPTIRHKKCLLLTPSESSCRVCRAFRVDLHVIASRLKQSPKVITTSSTIRNDALTHNQLLHKVKILKEENRCLKKKNIKLLDKIDGMIKEESDQLSKEHDGIIRQDVMESDDTFTAIASDESQRSSGGSNESPTAEQFGHNIALYVASSCVKASKRGNCRKDDENQSSIDATPLPKRQKKK